MAFPQKWLEEPPQIPDSKPDPAIKQFASYLRGLVLEGSAPIPLIAWLFGYEQKFTPADQRTVQIAEMMENAQTAPAQAQAALPAPIQNEVAGVLKEVRGVLGEIASAVKALGAVQNEALSKIDLAYASSLDKLNEGVEKLVGGFTDLTNDHRSFLGVIFPHVSQMYSTTNESMAAYRQSLVDTANAEKIRATAETANSIESEAGKSVLQLLTKAAEKKFLGEDEPPKPEPPKTEPTK